MVRDVRTTLYLMWGGALFVLLIGCVNVANLVLVRSRARLKELATRLALGARRGRIARQLITESLMLASCVVGRRPRSRLGSASPAGRPEHSGTAARERDSPRLGDNRPSRSPRVR